MEAGKFSFKFSRQTQKNLVGSSKYAYFRGGTNQTIINRYLILYQTIQIIQRGDFWGKNRRFLAF
jgi:hypothetical protein